LDQSGDPMRWRSQSVDFATDIGNLHAELILPQREEPFPGAVLCHGLGSDHRAMRPCARQIARHGIATLSFDFRGHGKSEGMLDGNEVQDVIAAVEFLRQQPEIDAMRIALVGHSLGAMAAINAAAEVENLSALVSLSSPSEMGGRAEGFLPSLYHKAAQIGSFVLEHPRHGPLPGLGKLEGMISVLWMWFRGYRLYVDWRKSLEIWANLKLSAAFERLGVFPKLFVHCKGDRATSYERVMELYRNVAPPKEFFLAEGGFHTTPLLPGRLRRRWVAWLISALT
jgi:pimeloyl-ACP methyl ester carboxylesterase